MKTSTKRTQVSRIKINVLLAKFASSEPDGGSSRDSSIESER